MLLALVFAICVLKYHLTEHLLSQLSMTVLSLATTPELVQRLEAMSETALHATVQLPV